MRISKCEEEALLRELARRRALERSRRLAEAAAERMRLEEAARGAEPEPPRRGAIDGAKAMAVASTRHVAAIARAARAEPQPLPWEGAA